MYKARICLLIVALIAAACALPLNALAGHASLKPEKAVSVKSATDKPVSSFAMKFDPTEISKGSAHRYGHPEADFQR